MDTLQAQEEIQKVILKLYGIAKKEKNHVLALTAEYLEETENKKELIKHIVYETER